ncbi:rabankyrin-5-like [Clavelina lepadiformis]|uniref:Ankyrin repeat domain-containing protein 39 n=1 Tax=Clavelina lepadiformis TaxID=159417 RepID=A0ABP0GH01_CLALP
MEDMHDCAHHDGGGVDGVFQSLNEMDFSRGPWTSASNGDYPYIQKYLDEGGEPNIRDSAGYTPLHYSARNGHEYITKALITSGALVNVQTRAGRATPLHRACQNNCPAIVKILLRHNADPCIQDADGKTPLHKAVESRSAKICKMLIENNPKCEEIPDNKAKMPKNYISLSEVDSEICKILKWRKS